MKTWIALVLALAALAPFALAAALDAARSGHPALAGGEGTSARDEYYKPVIPMETMMEAVDETFEAIGERIEDGKLKKATVSAYALAELINVVRFLESQEVQGAEKRKKWKEVAAQVRDQLVAVAEAAKKKEGAAAKSLFSKVEDTCETCHDMRE